MRCISSVRGLSLETLALVASLSVAFASTTTGTPKILMSSTCAAVAATDTTGVLQKMQIERRECGPEDVDIDVSFCGICHSDLHQIRGEWPQTVVYPMVPGHEVVGVVRAVGSDVKGFKVGDRVGVGCMVDSCRECNNCKEGEESYCQTGMTGTYNSLTSWYGRHKPRTKGMPGHPSEKEATFGGYSQRIVVAEKYVLRIPSNLDLAKAAPLLCAGITTYSPLVYHGAKAKGKDAKVGVVGFGGLGHMCAKLSKAMGNEVFVFSTSESKRAHIESLGAKFVLSKDSTSMAEVSGLDLIVDTVSAQHDLVPYVGKLRTGGTLCLVGIPPNKLDFHAFNIVGRKNIAGSLIGGIRETQEMLDFCAQHGIAADISLIHPRELNKAMHALSTNMAASERYVIDIAGLADDTDVDPEPKIDPSKWRVHDSATIVPAECRASAHAK